MSATAWALALAAALTSSHALMRQAAQYPVMTGSWILVVGSALAVYAAVFFAYTHLLRTFAISQLFPIYTALSVFGVFVVGVLLFDEPFSAAKVLGLILVAAGIFLLSS